jgi:hypothetical protein
MISDRLYPAAARTERMVQAVWLTAALVMSCMLAVALVASDGNIVVGAALVVLYCVVALTLYSVEWGFYILMFAILFFDQHNVRYVMPFTSSANYFANINLIPGMPRYMIVSLMELHLLFVLFVWMVRVAIGTGYTVQRIPLKIPAILAGAALALAIAHGAATGADPIIIMWEVRALVYLGILYCWTPQVIRTRSQLVTLVWVLIVGITIKALQGATFYALNGFSFGVWPAIIETYTNHEDPLFMILLFMLLTAFLALGVKSKQKTALFVLLMPLIVGFISGQRRATYASGMASMIGILVLLPKKNLITTLKFLAVFAVVFGIYAGAFWNSYSRLGYVAQQFKSTMTDEAGVRGSKDIESTLYRKAENFNLAVTFQRVPVEGIGFGKAYDRPLRPWGGDFPLSEYIPHNQIFWIFAKMGAIGGFFFWFFFNSLVVQGAIVFRRLEDPYLQAVCAMCVIAVINQMVVSYVDMQLTFSRNMLVLGTLMGLIQVLDRWTSPVLEMQTTD